ncbi:hypothetical protein SETIT_8G163900v2 [Setaria italica]|uniref:RING-type domain-containing protein n=1 Tax=Setaria italica TaxID=4555 RepID=K3ZL03_SETIT|nr:E3 ubiquitin-protein ligase EL5 [Setaria italica]RCV38709.1 hypothetical protein SETIT_8G163900v2 [Setaria italica]
MPMLAAVTCLARRRRMHCRGCDTAAAAAALELELGQHAPGDHRHRWRDELAPVGMPGGREQTRRQGRRRLPRDGGPALDSRRRQRQAVAAGAEQVPAPEEVRSQPGPGSCATVVLKKAPVAGDARAPASEAASSSSVLCAVCLEEVPTEAEATTLPCSHSYHAGCVLPWLAAHGACPCCRATVPSPENYILTCEIDMDYGVESSF